MEWVRGRTIGHGSFGTVSIAKPTNNDSGLPPLLAMKTCALSHSTSLMNERMILEQLKDCSNIITCFGDSVTSENGQKLYNVALEYAAGGALSEKVKNPKNPKNRLSENEVKRYTNSILKGLCFIHRSGFVHCDMKLQNVLLVCENGTETVKIADFGLAKKVNVVNSEYDVRGTPMYMAPETVVGGEQEPAADVWALGCMVTEMVTGKPVWNCSDVGGLLMKIGIGGEIPEIPGKLSDDGKDFLGKCFLKDPRERWTAEMLLRHPFVNTVGIDAVGSEETLKETSEGTGSQISPRDPFGFCDWETEELCLSTPEEVGLPESLPATRLGRLMTDEKPDWSVSNSWVKVR